MDRPAARQILEPARRKLRRVLLSASGYDKIYELGEMNEALRREYRHKLQLPGINFG